MQCSEPGREMHRLVRQQQYGSRKAAVKRQDFCPKSWNKQQTSKAPPKACKISSCSAHSGNSPGLGGCPTT
jgi:hypothetical protein